jgi:hypothetical protein
MDPMQFLTSRQTWKLAVMQAIAREAARIRQVEHDDLASRIANAVAKAFGGK